MEALWWHHQVSMLGPFFTPSHIYRTWMHAHSWRCFSSHKYLSKGKLDKTTVLLIWWFRVHISSLWSERVCTFSLLLTRMCISTKTVGWPQFTVPAHICLATYCATSATRRLKFTTSFTYKASLTSIEIS